jgi:hypothetical protein
MRLNWLKPFTALGQQMTALAGGSLVPPRRRSLQELKRVALRDAPDSVSYGWNSAGEALRAAEQELMDAREAVNQAALPDGPWRKHRSR